MRGRNFHTWSTDRVIADIADARARGARAIFIVDDNITLNVAPLPPAVRRDCRRRPQRHRLHRPGHDERRGVGRRRARGGDATAGFRYVFLGIENVLDQDLGFLKARAKNAEREAAGASATPPRTRWIFFIDTACSSWAA